MELGLLALGCSGKNPGYEPLMCNFRAIIISFCTANCSLESNHPKKFKIQPPHCTSCSQFRLTEVVPALNVKNKMIRRNRLVVHLGRAPFFLILSLTCWSSQALQPLPPLMNSWQRRGLLKCATAAVLAVVSLAPSATNALVSPQQSPLATRKETTGAAVAQSLPPPGVAAYKSLTISGDLGVEVPVACWFPVDQTPHQQLSSQQEQRLTTPAVRYQHRISVRKIGQLLAGWDFIPEFVSRKFALSPTFTDSVLDGQDLPLPSRAPVVVLAHGYLGSRFDLSHLAEHLASRGFVCVAPEYPESLAASFDSSGLDRARITQPLLDALQDDWHIRPTRYGIVGHSLGCGTALETGDDSWSRVLIAGFPRFRDGRPVPGNMLLLTSMNDGAVSLARMGGRGAIPTDFAVLDPTEPNLDRLPRRAVLVFEGKSAPNHISFLSEGVNDAMIDLLSPLLPVAQALEIPVLDFDKYQLSRDSVATARVVHPIVTSYLEQQMLSQ